MFKSLFGFFNNQFAGEVFDDDEITVVLQEEMLSQGELQMLQRIVAYTIFEEEQYYKGAKNDAQCHPVGDEDRNYWFKRARKHQAKIKKLSALQYRLKHKIATRG